MIKRSCDGGGSLVWQDFTDRSSLRLHRSSQPQQRLTPLFDHNLALFPYLMEQDDAEEYYKGQGPRLGGDFIETARAMLTPETRADLINLKGFDYKDPGYGFPAWKLKTVNELKDRQIKAILE